MSPGAAPSGQPQGPLHESLFSSNEGRHLFDIVVDGHLLDKAGMRVRFPHSRCAHAFHEQEQDDLAGQSNATGLAWLAGQNHPRTFPGKKMALHGPCFGTLPQAVTVHSVTVLACLLPVYRSSLARQQTNLSGTYPEMMGADGKNTVPILMSFVVGKSTGQPACG